MNKGGSESSRLLRLSKKPAECGKVRAGCDCPFYGTGSMLEYRQIRKGFGRTGGFVMKGFYTASGFCGMVEDKYMLFASEADYYEYMSEE